MKRAVVDTSVMLRLVGAHGDGSRVIELVSGFSLQAPELLLVECAHVLGKLVRGRAMPIEQALRRMQVIAATVNIHTTVDDPVACLATVHHLQHSAYDVRFLMLAQRLGLPLVTLDEVFAKKVRRAGIEVVVDTLSAG